MKYKIFTDKILVHNFAKIMFCLMLIISTIITYTKVMGRIGSGTPPEPAPVSYQADNILVSKADRVMELFREGRLLRRYQITMGRNWDKGHKQKEGDERTPEGRYVIDWRNEKSVAYLSLHISYPNEVDRKHARKEGYDPGGNIMIHGLPNGWGAIGNYHTFVNWTDGCIAVTNDEMREIWSLVPNGTPIEIIR